MNYNFTIKNLHAAGERESFEERIMSAAIERYKYHQFIFNRFFRLSFYKRELFQFTNWQEKSSFRNEVLVVGRQEEDEDALRLYMYIYDHYHYYPVGSYWGAESGYEEMFLTHMYRSILPIDNRLQKMEILEIFRNIYERRERLKPMKERDNR